MLISTALLLDSNIRNSVCTPAKLPCRQVVEDSDNNKNSQWNEATFMRELKSRIKKNKGTHSKINDNIQYNTFKRISIT
jgi:hypothetical protein